MTSKQFAQVAVLALAVLATGCANTIRGVGQDAANTVSASKSAGKKVVGAAQ